MVISIFKMEIPCTVLDLPCHWYLEYWEFIFNRGLNISSKRCHFPVANSSILLFHSSVNWTYVYHFYSYVKKTCVCCFNTSSN